MRAICIVPAMWLLLGAACSARTSVKASQFGFDPVDSTAALQAAFDSDADTVVVDNTGADWIARPLFVRRDAADAQRGVHQRRMAHGLEPAVIPPGEESIDVAVTWRPGADLGRTLVVTLPESRYYKVAKQ